MNKVLPFLKSHGIILVCLIVPVGAIVAGWIFSAKWNDSIKQNIEQKVQGEIRNLDGLTQRFEISVLDPDDQPIGFSMVPNPATVELARQKLQSNIDQTERIRALALQHNKRDKSLLIDGPRSEDKLFPEPDSNASRLRKLSEIRSVWPQAHLRLLEDAQAGPRPDPAQVVEQLTQFREAQIAAFLGDRVDQTLSEEESDAIEKRVSDRRVELYRARAAELAFYASLGSFVGVHTVAEAPTIPEPSLATAWDWQHRYWVNEEIVRALREANTEPTTGFFIPVHRAPVKRLGSITIEPWSFTSAPAATPTPAAQEIRRDFATSVTGLTSWPETPNALYDVRDATIVIHAASGRIDDILEALQARNFINITSVNIADVDEYQAFTQGFDYGTDHVIELTIGLQTIWLREWTSKTMPPAVRSAMGVPDPAPQEEQAS
ncbi:MAG: hypothetical protein RLN60_00810 [Phycisphaerales bacterium]